MLARRHRRDEEAKSESRASRNGPFFCGFWRAHAGPDVFRTSRGQQGSLCSPTVPPPDPFGLVGQVLDGQFRVDAAIGEGGFSVVYRGHHIGLDEPIAIKALKLPPSLATAVMESFVLRFRDEGKLLYRLSSGNLNIVRGIASGTLSVPASKSIIPYMVLEWLEGRSLDADFDQRRAEGKPGRTLSEVIDLFDSAADALTYAFTQGVVHRDLNPGNLFLARSRDGSERMKVLDFGLAKVVNDAVLAMGPRAQTLAQMRVFSPAYAAPEQFDGALGTPGPATDVYTLALVMTQALRGQAVIDGETLGEFYTKVADPAVLRTPRGVGVPVGPATEAVFARALALDPAARFPNIGLFWSALHEAAGIDVVDEESALSRRKTLRMASPVVSPPAAPPTTPASSPFTNLTDLKSTARMGPSRPPPVPRRSVPSPISPVSGPLSSSPRAPPPAAPPVGLAPSVVVSAPLPPAPLAPPAPSRPQSITIPPQPRPPEEITANRRQELQQTGPSMGTKVLVGVLVFVAVLVFGTLGIVLLQQRGGGR